MTSTTGSVRVPNQEVTADHEATVDQEADVDETLHNYVSSAYALCWYRRNHYVMTVHWTGFSNGCFHGWIRNLLKQENYEKVGFSSYEPYETLNQWAITFTL